MASHLWLDLALWQWHGWAARSLLLRSASAYGPRPARFSCHSWSRAWTMTEPLKRGCWPPSLSSISAETQVLLAMENPEKKTKRLVIYAHHSSVRTRHRGRFSFHFILTEGSAVLDLYFKSRPHTYSLTYCIHNLYMIWLVWFVHIYWWLHDCGGKFIWVCGWEPFASSYSFSLTHLQSVGRCWCSLTSSQQRRWMIWHGWRGLPESWYWWELLILYLSWRSKATEFVGP